MKVRLNNVWLHKCLAFTHTKRQLILSLQKNGRRKNLVAGVYKLHNSMQMWISVWLHAQKCGVWFPVTPVRTGHCWPLLLMTGRKRPLLRTYLLALLHLGSCSCNTVTPSKQTVCECQGCLCQWHTWTHTHTHTHGVDTLCLWRAGDLQHLCDTPECLFVLPQTRQVCKVGRLRLQLRSCKNKHGPLIQLMLRDVVRGAQWGETICGTSCGRAVGGRTIERVWSLN